MNILVINDSPKGERSDTLKVTRADSDKFLYALVIGMIQ